jgi:tripartite-type tricarboxylate transporter receptor subunit TctC
MAELGFAAANLASVFGVFAPGRTPQPIVARVNEAFNRALRHPDFRHRLEAINNLPTGGTPADFAERIARERRPVAPSSKPRGAADASAVSRASRRRSVGRRMACPTRQRGFGMCVKRDEA